MILWVFSNYYVFGENVWSAVTSNNLLHTSLCHDFPVPATPISISRSFILLRFFILVIGFILKYLSMRIPRLKVKCQDFKSNLLQFSRNFDRFISFVNKTLFWVKRKVNLQFTQPLKHFLKIRFGRASASKGRFLFKSYKKFIFISPISTLSDSTDPYLAQVIYGKYQGRLTMNLPENPLDLGRVATLHTSWSPKFGSSANSNQGGRLCPPQ